MYDYSNFGLPGLAISGIVLAIFLIMVSLIFEDHWKASVIFNFFPLLALGSAAITTVLLTHGWATMILLYYLNRKNLNELIEQRLSA